MCLRLVRTKPDFDGLYFPVVSSDEPPPPARPCQSAVLRRCCSDFSTRRPTAGVALVGGRFVPRLGELTASMQQKNNLHARENSSWTTPGEGKKASPEIPQFLSEYFGEGGFSLAR
jgi:hypothetical protein